METSAILLMVHTALMLARGEKLFETFEVSEAERILYLAPEDPPRRVKKRLLDTDRTGNLCAPRKFEFYVASGLRLNDCLCRDWLVKFLEDGKYDVEFIDTFQKATPGVLSFDDKELSPILHSLADLARQTGAGRSVGAAKIVLQEETTLKFWGVDNLADYLDVPKTWIYDRTRENGPEVIPHMKFGKHVRFHPESPALQKWLREHEVSTSVGSSTQRSKVQILPPRPCNHKSAARKALFYCT